MQLSPFLYALVLIFIYPSAFAAEKQFHEGPNCLNTALLLKGVVTEKIYSSNDLFLTYINSADCRELTETEQSIRGDIGLILNKNFLLNSFVSHAFTYLNHEMIFEKEGLSPNAPYRSRHFKDTLKDYEIESEICSKKFDPKSCLNSMTRYRCIAHTPDLNELIIDLARNEKKVSRLVWNKTATEDLELIKSELLQLEHKIRSSKPFQAEIMLERINSIRLQIGMLRN